MALSFIGKPISLISHSDVRYRGILAGIDPNASTIQLSNVYSMGTESRRPPEQFIPPVQEPYAYIIFRASEVKDLAVDEPAPRRSVHDDPAVLGASAPIAQGSFGYPGQGQQPQPQQPPQSQPSPQPPQQQAQQQQQQRQNGQQQQQRQAQAPAASPAASAAAQPASAGPAAGNNKTARPNAVTSATASLETVERALGDLRVSSDGGQAQVPQAAVNHHINNNNNNHHHRGGPRRGGHHGGRGGHGHGHGHDGVKVGDLKVPTTDFDFASSNARFDKAALGPRPSSAAKELSVGINGEGSSHVDDVGDATGENGKGKEKDQGVGAGVVNGGAKGQEGANSAPAYDPKKSFFDSLSSGSNAPSPADGTGRGGGRGGRRGGGGRNRREEERERNVATFGEPGGIGLMGPGAYVGGWGGYGRRGGGRGRRGGSAVGAR